MKEKILIDTFYLNASSIAVSVLGFIQNIIIMRFLNPESYGIWIGLMVILTYKIFTTFGIEYGFGLRVPYYQGKQDFDMARQISDTAYLSWSGLNMLFSIGLFCYAFFVHHESAITLWGLVILGLMTITEQQISFMMRYQTNSLYDFKLGSKLSILRGILSFFLLIPLVYFFNIEGLMAGTLVLSILMMIIWRTKTTYKFKFKVSSSAFIELVRIGFPVLLVTAGGMLMSSLDRLMILKFLGASSLGYYALVSMGGTMIYGFLGQAGTSIGPHITKEMGKSNNYAPSLEKFLIKPTIIFAYTITLLISLLVIFLPPLVEIVLTKYRPGLAAFYIYVPCFFFLSIILTANNILNVVLIAIRKQKYIVILQGLTILIQISLSYFFITINLGILGVALASSLATAFYGITILFFSAKYVLLKTGKAIGLLVDVLIPFVYSVILLVILEWIVHSWFPISPILRTVVMLSLWCAAIFPLLYIFNKKVQILSEIAPIYNELKMRFRTIRYGRLKR